MTCRYQMYYRLIGPDSRDTAVFLHGFLGDAEEWAEIVEGLSSTTRCLLIDLPGHGRTVVHGDVSCYSIVRCAAEVSCLVDDLRIERPCAIGYSMGGRLALYLGVNHPDRFSRIVLESASPGILDASERHVRLVKDRVLAKELQRTTISHFVATWYAQPLFDSLRDHPKFDSLMAMRKRNDTKELAKALRGMSVGGQSPLWGRLARHGNPILILVGEYDKKYRGIAKAMARTCKTAAVREISGCGHNVHFERPEAYTTELCNFLVT